MHPSASTTSNTIDTCSNDEWVFGWDPMPGIVSVWASRDGRAIVWRRESEQVFCSKERFRPWILATTTSDLAHLGSALATSSSESHGNMPLVSYRTLDGANGSYS